jgi:hypothetical protein
MADSTILNLDLQTTGANAGTWGTKTNDNLEKVENAIKGYLSMSVAGSGTQALTASSGGTGDQQSRAVLNFTGTLSGGKVVECEAHPYWYIIKDSTTRAGNTLTFGPAGGTAVTLKNTCLHFIYTDGSTAYNIPENLANMILSGTLTVGGDVSLDGGQFVFNQAGADLDARFEGSGDIDLLRTEGTNDRVGVGIASPLGKLHVRQSAAAGAVPVIEMEQLDQDYAFTNYVGTSTAGGANSLSSSVATAGVKAGAIRVRINGVDRWIRFYDSAV